MIWLLSTRPEAIIIFAGVLVLILDITSIVQPFAINELAG
jgi:hypothetical protein